MSDIFDNLSDKIQNISNRIVKDGKKYFQSAFSKGEEIGYKGKIKLEIEKLKWELKKKYTTLGKYVSDNKISKSVTNFSHDSNFLALANDVYKLKLYIEELEKRTKKKLTKK
jgi:thiamine pyrophosphokinase